MFNNTGKQAPFQWQCTDVTGYTWKVLLNFMCWGLIIKWWGLTKYLYSKASDLINGWTISRIHNKLTFMGIGKNVRHEQLKEWWLILGQVCLPWFCPIDVFSVLCQLSCYLVCSTILSWLWWTDSSKSMNQNNQVVFVNYLVRNLTKVLIKLYRAELYVLIFYILSCLSWYVF